VPFKVPTDCNFNRSKQFNPITLFGDEGIQACRLRARIAGAEAAAIAAKRKAEFHAFIEEKYNLDSEDGTWGHLNKFVKSAAAKGNEEIARFAEEAGMSLEFGPTLTIDYGPWPSVYYQWRREDMWEADCRIRRLEKEAALQIERIAIETQTRLIAECLTLARQRRSFKRFRPLPN
jgi:hypothetical protein